MGLELGELEEYGFRKSAKCGGYCFPKDMNEKEFSSAANMFVDRFAASVKNQYEVAMCHPVLAPYRPRVEVIWNIWPFSFLFGLQWRIILDTFTCQSCCLRFLCIPCEVISQTVCQGCALVALAILVACFPCTFCIALINQCLR